MSSFNPTFAIAAAHGITPRTIATWSPQLPRSPRVQVPIQVDALAVRTAGGEWANCGMTVPAQGSTGNTRSGLLPPPFANLPPNQRGTGVYLHWALPDGLTAGTAGSDTTAPVFPVIPNRWLVLRVFTSPVSISRRTVAGWILRAGDATPQAVALDSFTEDNTDQGTLIHSLTALGHGDMAWAAYYDNVVNRMAFFDPLNDAVPPNGPLAYMVCGWYTDPSSDPLGSKIDSLSDFDARMAQLGWELAAGELQESANHSYDHIVAANRIGLPVNEAFNLQQTPPVFAGAAAAKPRLALSPGTFVPPVPYVNNIRTTPAPVDPSGQPQGGSYTTNGSWWPKMTLYHGSVVAIAWPGPNLPGSTTGLLTGQIGGPPPASQISVAVGSTMAEAMGALIAKTNSASDAADQARALEAFMSGSMADLDLPDGAARVDVRLHADSFGSVAGQETTEDIVQPRTPDIHPLPTPPSSLDPGVFAGEVTAIPSQTPFRSPVTNLVSTDVEVDHFLSPELSSERNFISGGLLAASGTLAQPSPPTPTPSQTITVKRTAPRFFFPSDPVFLVQNADRSYKHGYDGRFSEDGNLICRLSGFAVTELSCADPTAPGGRYAVSAADVLDRGVENGSVPPDCEDLLKELILLDPGSAYAAAQVNVGAGTNLAARIQNLQVEQTSWWATRDSRVDQAPLTALSGLAGMLPSPIAVNPPVLPWTPLHLDWAIQFIPSARGVSDWVLDEIDFAPGSQTLPDPGDTKSGVQLSGRVHLTSGAPAAIASSVRLALAQAQRAAGSGPLTPNVQARFNSQVSQKVLGSYSTMIANTRLSPRGAVAADVSPIDRTSLADLASSLENMDMLTGALDNFRTKLRAGVAGDGTSTPSKPGVPANFIPIRAGFMRILRLRIVDCFGQFVDLAGSSASTIVDPTQLIASQPMQVPGRNDILALPPRFTSPTRAWFRYQDAAGSKTDAGATVSPVCGFLLPNHLDGDLEFFDASGNNLGDVRPDPQAGIIWEDSPGTPAAAGKSPSDVVSNPFLAGIAQGLISWGFADISLGQGAREDALSALLRIIDSTLWSVDPYAHSGDEHLALLIGHPVVVMRAVVRVEVSEPVTPSTVNQARVPVRLGALTHWQDGLFGYFVNDDYQTLYCADQAVAGFARDVGPGQGFLRPINLVPNFYQTFSDDLASPNQFTYSGAPVPQAVKRLSPRIAAPASADTLIPLLTGMSPASGAPAGGTAVTITGLNFTGVTAVRFGSTPASSFAFVSDSEITAVSPAGTGVVPVTVTTPVGTSASQGTVTEGNNPVNHPYVDTSGVMLIPPNQDVPVTLLLEPHSFVHATTGITPRKEIGMRREWVASALSKIAPTFRFGPVLVDPQRIRMPVPNDIHGTWSWDHRSSITDWAEDKVTNTTGDALIPPDPAKAQEGWLRMQPQAAGGSSGGQTS
jgi:IPT/TIG domain